MIALSRMLTDPVADDTLVSIRGEERLGFSVLRQETATLKNWISKRSEGAIALVDEDGFRFLVGLMAALHAGREVLLLPNDRPETIREISDQDVFVLTEEAYRQAQEGPTGPLAMAPLSFEEASLIILTSGSTGKPKRVRKRLRQLEAEVANLERAWGGAIGDGSVFATVPHKHIYGLLFKILWPLSAGRPFHSRSADYWETVFDAMRCHRITVVSSPSHLTRFPVLDALDPGDHPDLVFSSGAPLPADAAKTCEHILGSCPIEVFGSTETGGVAWRRQTAANAPWSAFDGIEVRSRDDGILEIRSPYLDTGAWSATSDRATFLDDHRFVLTGRADRVVKVEGKRVSLPEIEGLLTKSPWVRDAAALIADDKRSSLAAVVVLTEEGRAILAAEGPFRLSRRLRAELGLKLEPAVCPRRWRFVDEIPTNNQGKRTLEAMRALFDSSKPGETWRDTRHFPIVRSRRSDETGHAFKLFVPRDLFQFRGHFPDWPILPGVAQLDWAVHFAEQALERSLTVREVHNLKFVRTVSPDAVLLLRIEADPASGRIRFEYREGDQPTSFGVLVVEPQ